MVAVSRVTVARKLGSLVTVWALLLFAPLAQAENKFVQGKGQFSSKDEDSLSFVKKQLLASAFRDVITQELKDMGLDTNLFWQQYDKKFQDYFGPTVDKLKGKFEIDDNTTDREKLKNYQKALRKKRLRSRAEFGRLNRAIPSYSIKRMSRSTQVPNSRYLTLEAKVDREVLTDIYYDFTREGKARHFNKLFLTTRYHLKGMNWQDTGVQLQRDFTEVVDSHWRDWLRDHLSSYVEEVILTDRTLEDRLEKFLLISPELGASAEATSVIGEKILGDGEREKGSQQEQEQEQGQGQENDEDQVKNHYMDKEMSEFANSLWLKLSVEIKKIDERPFLKTRKFEIDGEFVLVDLKTNKLIKSFDFIREIEEFSTKDPHELSSNLASLVYRTPVIEFEKLTQAFNRFSAGLRTFRVEVNSLSSIQELLKVSTLLQEEGVTARVNTKIQSYDGQKGKIFVEYYGDKKKLRSILHSLEGKEIGEGRRIALPEKGKPSLMTIQGPGISGTVDHGEGRSSSTSSRRSP